MEDVVNVTSRVTWEGGWIGLLRGESQGKAIDRELAALNDLGFSVVFIVPDRWNPFLRLFWILLGIASLGIFWKQENLLIIAEGPIQAPEEWGVEPGAELEAEDDTVGTQSWNPVHPLTSLRPEEWYDESDDAEA